MPDDDADYGAIGRQVVMLVRLSERLFATMKAGAAYPKLERPAYTLLSRVVVDGPFRLSALAAEVCLDLSTVSRQVAALETAGLVRRTADAADRRASLIEATETGGEVFSTNRERWLGIWRDVLSDWTPEQRRTFADLCTQLNHALAVRLPGPVPAPAGEQENR